MAMPLSHGSANLVLATALKVKAFVSSRLLSMQIDKKACSFLNDFYLGITLSEFILYTLISQVFFS
jgi:hypothetical protein